MAKRRARSQIANLIDSRPLKFKDCPNFLVCKLHATYHYKAFDKGYNFALDLTSISGLHKTLSASKVVKVLIPRISRLRVDNPETK
jgi:hypothetical protein